MTRFANATECALFVEPACANQVLAGTQSACLLRSLWRVSPVGYLRAWQSAQRVFAAESWSWRLDSATVLWLATAFEGGLPGSAAFSRAVPPALHPHNRYRLVAICAALSEIGSTLRDCGA